MGSNFAFLNKYWPQAARMGALAEQYALTDQAECGHMISRLADHVARQICLVEQIDLPEQTAYADRLRALRYDDALPPQADELFIAAGRAGCDDGLSMQELLRKAFFLCSWFMASYGEWEFSAAAYEPVQEAASEEELQQLQQALEQDEENPVTTPAAEAPKSERSRKAREAARQLPAAAGEDSAVKLTASILPVINYAMQQNGAVMVRSITIENHSKEDIRNARLEISAMPELFLPFTCHVDWIPAGEELSIAQPKLVINAQYLASMTEKVTGAVYMRLYAEEKLLAQQVAQTTVLAFDEWHGLGIYPEMIAAFVTPNHPQVAKILARASEYLGKWTGDTAFDAYQRQDPNRVVSQAAAIYTAIKELSIVYVVPPASFEKIGQRVRLCDMIAQQKMGNCLDLTLLYASCLEAAGLHPILISTPGHIFSGVWLEEQMFPECVQDDATLITKRLASGVNEIAVLETTSAVNSNNGSFDDARKAAEKQLVEKSVQFIIDVHTARQSGVHPLPQRKQAEEGWVVEHDAPRGGSANAPKPLDETIHVDPTAGAAAQPKLVQWERKLLDLGLRNTLINLRITKTQLPILTSSLDELENALADGSDFSILPRPTDWPAEEFTFENLSEKSEAGIIRAEFENKRLRTILTQSELGTAIKGLYRTAKTALEENGANTLYLALGMLRWYETEKSAKARYAPLILVPIEMVRKSAAQGYVIRLRDDEPQMNITILEKLKQDFGITVNGVDPLPMDEHGIDLRRVLTIVRKAVMEQPRWDVLEAASIGIFSFSQFVMWNDLRNRTEDLMRNKVVRSLIEGKLTWQAEPLEMGQKVDERDVLLPMPADASQLYAIRAANSGESFVLHGPPGTGKSQTITSLIANALAGGKRVLFVAEKMAALDVVRRRLENIGIGPFCLELHSNKSKKKDVLEQLRRVSEVTKTTTAAEFAAKADQLAAMRKDLDGYAAALHRVQPCGSTLHTMIGEYESYRQAEDLPAFERSFLQKLDKAKLEQHELVLEQLVAAGRAVGHPAGHSLLPVGCSQYTQQLRGALQPAVEAYLHALQQLAPYVSALCQAMGKAQPACKEEVKKLGDIACALAGWYDLPAQWAKTGQPETYFANVTRMGKHYLAAISLREKLCGVFDARFLDEDGEQLMREYTQTAARWFLPRFFGMNKLRRRINVHAKTPVDKTAVKDWISCLCDHQKNKKQADELFGTYGAELGSLYCGENTSWQTVCDKAAEALKLAQTLQQLCGSLDVMNRLGGAAEVQEPVFAIKEQLPTLQQAHNAAVQLLRIAPRKEENWIDGQIAMCMDILDHADEIKEWTAFVSAMEQTRQLGLDNVLGRYLSGMGHDDVVAAYRKALLHGLICAAIDDSGELHTFSGSVFNTKIEQYKRADRDWSRLSQQEAYCRLAAKVPDFTREAVNNSELGILQRCIRSGGRGTSIRKLFDQIPNLLPRLCPCMLMSPISAAQYLDPKGEPFDIVVFDEASQLPTCKAVGVLARGKEAVIVGDPKQMPPTSFFAINTVDEENLETEDLESILDDCLALNMPQSHLLWHYRSRHESLIAFSNRRFYENRLFTFPSVNDRESKVRFVPVDGVFDRGRSRTNKAEAQAVVEELRRRCHDPELSGQSVGVVTFNISQQHLIDDLLNEACAADAELEKWAYGADEPLFIKNLENVQGDERDVILFSIGYGPDADGKVYMNFGPLNRDGGWRRLNVAVSRARCEMVIFSTLQADQIDLSRTKSEGVAALRDFLEYARRRTLAMEAGEAEQLRRPGGIARSIVAQLEKHGFEADCAVGRSEYRIDVAVVDPADPEKYLLGILLDGAGYGTARTTRDREVAQISVLNGLGWNIMRVWSMDWWDNSGKELQRILTTLSDIQSGKLQIVEEEPAPAQTPETAAPAPKQPESTAPMYEMAVLPSMQLTAEAFTQPAYVNNIRHRVEKVIEAEAPVSAAVLIKRVVLSYGIARSGSRIQAHMEQILQNMRPKFTRQNGVDFYWRADQKPEEYIGYRVSTDGQRDVREVPVQEIANAVYTVLFEQVSMGQEDLLREAAKKLGYTRLGGNVTAALSSGVRYAQAKGGVSEGANGMLILTELGTARAKACLDSFAKK